MSHDTIPESEPVADAEETSRRDLVLGVITGAAGAAMIAGSTAEAQTLSAAPARRRRYVVAFRQSPTLPRLQAALERMVGIAGCTRCGLGGFDLLLAVNPAAQGQPLPGGAVYNPVGG